MWRLQLLKLPSDRNDHSDWLKDCLHLDNGRREETLLLRPGWQTIVRILNLPCAGTNQSHRIVLTTGSAGKRHLGNGRAQINWRFWPPRFKENNRFELRLKEMPHRTSYLLKCVDEEWISYASLQLSDENRSIEINFTKRVIYRDLQGTARGYLCLRTNQLKCHWDLSSEFQLLGWFHWCR